MSNIINLENIIDVLEVNKHAHEDLPHKMGVDISRVEMHMDSIMDLLPDLASEALWNEGEVNISIRKDHYYRDAINVILSAELNEAENFFLLLFAAEYISSLINALERLQSIIG